MSAAAISVAGLSKRFRVGERERYVALRDLLARAITAPFRRKAGPATNGSGYIWALRDVTFEVREGETIGIIGRNGAGKSTLLKILASITQPTEGCAEVRGRVGSLLEIGTGIHPELTGRENIYFSGSILGMKRREMDRKFGSIVEFSGVEKFLDTPMKHYSSGMQLRLAFSVAAHLDPEIFIADEVLAVGDLEFQKKCLGKMGEVAGSGRTVLFVSHQLNQIRRLCARVMWLDAGRILCCGPTAEIVTRYEAAMASGNGARPAPGEVPRGRGRFLGWRILDPQGGDPHSLEAQGPVKFAFDLELNQPVQGGRHRILLYNRDGLLVWGDDTPSLNLSPGRHRLVYRFAGLPLRPGPYSWLLGLYDDRGGVDECHCVPQLNVCTEPLNNLEDERTGLLNISPDFSVDV
jgi:homopolymeric O-antigen transport system ATP-binding protein